MSRFALAVLVMITLVLLLPTSSPAQKAGDVVFSKQMINAGAPVNLTNTFQAGDPIYAVAYVKSSFAKIAKAPDAKKIDVEVFLYVVRKPKYDYQEPQEEQLVFGSLGISGGAIQREHLLLDIVPVPGQMTAYGNAEYMYKKFGQEFDGPVKYAAALSKLEGGKQVIRIKVNCHYETVAEGEFTIEGSDFSGYEQQSQALNSAAGGIQTKNAMMPKAGMSDKTLEAEMIGALKASQTYKDRMQGSIVKFVITDREWYVRRHEISGIILHRYIRAAVAIKNASGKCTVWPLMTFQQDYVGNKYQKSKFDGVGDPYAIPCESIK